MSFFYSLLFLPLLFLLITSENNCPTSSCNSSNFNVKFPFYMAKTPADCTYPGFELSCTKQGLTSLYILYWGNFLVRYINYRTQELIIYDPRLCLAERLMHFDLSFSPFMSPYYTNFTFLTCPTKLVKKSNYRVIECLSDSVKTTLATTSSDYAANLSSCEIIGDFKIPVSRPGPYDDDIISFVVNNDILLTWDRPNCMECEAKGAKCGINIDKSYQAVCYPVKGKNNGLQIFKIVSLSIAVPGIACVIAFAFVVCTITHSARQLRDHGFMGQEIAPQIETNTITGLDESTIESYTKVTLGESMRLPGPWDGTCAICLSEFSAKEIIKIIPECMHCFHTTCIDEWLRIRSTCPVCRNSPSSLSTDENLEQG